MSAADKLEKAAETFRQKSKEYGNNIEMIGHVCEALFPNGLMLRTADDFNRFHLFLLVGVKQSRYATNWSKGGHADSIHDLTVYAAMLDQVDEDIIGGGETGEK